jgi:hypothetical protein
MDNYSQNLPDSSQNAYGYSQQLPEQNQQQSAPAAAWEYMPRERAPYQYTELPTPDSAKWTPGVTAVYGLYGQDGSFDQRRQPSTNLQVALYNDPTNPRIDQLLHSSHRLKSNSATVTLASKKFGIWEKQTKPACLLTYHFQFHPGRELNEAKVNLRFYSKTSSGRAPRICCYGPASLSGPPTKEDRKRTYRGSAHLSAGSVGLVNAGLDGSIGYEKRYVQEHFPTLSVACFQDKKGACNINFVLKEDDAQHMGVPQLLTVVVVVQYETEFYVSAKTHSFLRGALYEKLTPQIDPIVRPPLDAYNPTNFKAYGESQWRDTGLTMKMERM